MKKTEKNTDFKNQVLDYLITSAGHLGYIWDGLEIAPGMAVASYKTIAADTGLSYYRVRKIIATLVEEGKISISRHKCFAVFVLNDLIGNTPTRGKINSRNTEHLPERNKSTIETTPCPDRIAEDTPACVTQPPRQRPGRAERRRLARLVEKQMRRIKPRSLSSKC